MNPRFPTTSAPPDVTLLCNRFWPDLHGGVEQRMWHTARALAQRGLRVRVLTANRTGAAPFEIFGDRVEVIRWAPCDPGRLWRIEPMARLQWWRRCLAEGFTGGPIWATDPPSALGAILAGHGAELIYNPAACVAAMRRVGRCHAHADSLRRPRLLSVMDRLAVRGAAKIVLASKNLATQFAPGWHHGASAHIIPHGVVTPKIITPSARKRARRCWHLPEPSFVIGYVGRLDPCKDLDFLFDAVSRVSPGRSWRILLVGDGPDRTRLTSVAKQYGVRDRMVLAGRMDDPAAAYAAMDVLVLPSVYEAFGNVLPEAMVHGIPVVARAPNGHSVLTAAEEIIDHGRTGYVSDSIDSADLGHRLRSLATTPGLATWMGGNARLTWLPRTWNRYAAQAADVISDIGGTRKTEPFDVQHRRAA